MNDRTPFPSDTDAPLIVISGGQTGADRAALDAAMDVGVPVGGWCPCGRKAEDGRIDDRYPLEETPEPDVDQRTTWNVRDADATLVLTLGDTDSGTAFTVDEARRLGRPVRVVRLGSDGRFAAAEEVVDGTVEWIRRSLPDEAERTVLNVAGPRESNAPGLYASACRFMRRLLRRLIPQA
jgi:hypothetical protein